MSSWHYCRTGLLHRSPAPHAVPFFSAMQASASLIRTTKYLRDFAKRFERGKVSFTDDVFTGDFRLGPSARVW
jgi:hypothetical protein